MVFSSSIFLFRYLPIILLLYFAIPRKFKNGLLFLASLLFYAWGEPVYVVLMLFSTVVDYTHGRLVDKFIKLDNKKKAKLIVLSSVIINLGLLSFFKYSDFLIETINQIFNSNIGLLELPLPIGISFYTFQTMSYTIDIYRGEGKVQKNIIDFGAYVALFPQLIAGPIVKYKDIDQSLRNRKSSIESISKGVVRFTIGLGKKVLLANNIGILWETIFATSSLSVFNAWIGIVAFAFQIYFDFSGYSDMAIGLGYMFGFDFKENFNYPYVATSITDFWRRWHISLSSWFRDYVYIPLGGNRVGRLKLVRNILVVWCLTGIWHGASWNFLLWGFYFAVLLLGEKLIIGRLLDKAPTFIKRIYTIVLILISWCIFAFDNISVGINYLGTMFGVNAIRVIDDLAVYNLINYGAIFILLILAATPIPKRIYAKINTIINNIVQDKKTITVRKLVFSIVSNLCFIAVLLLSIAYIIDASYNPFLYFRF